MATSSITKQFVVKDPKVWDDFVKDLEKPSAPRKNPKENALEEGKKALAKYLSR